MQQHELTPAQKVRIKKQEERRRRERRQREEDYRRRIERLRRQIEEARKRRQRLMLLLLLAILAMQDSILAVFTRSFMLQPDYDPEPKDWTPDPTRDYAPRSGSDDYCDGYSREQWMRMLNERGIKMSRKAELQAAWEADPERELFPVRYQLWGHKPYIGQVMEELTTPYWQQDALAAIKLLSPPETHKYLDEAYAIDPGDLRQCLADRDADIIQAFQARAILWTERRRKEAEEARKAKNDKKPDGDEKKFEP